MTAVKVALGQDPPGAKPGKGKPGKGKAKPGRGRKPATRKNPPLGRTRAQKNPAAQKKPAAQKSPGAEKNPAKESPGGEASANAGEVALSTSSTEQLVQLKVKPEQQQLARLGETVAVLLPGGGRARGHITEVGTVASEPSGSGDEGKGSPSGESGESATIPVTIALDRHVAHLDQAPVSVELVKSIRRNVLTVPATALLATAGGGYAVEALEQDRRVTVPVTPGMFADGYVQVEGAGVRDGLTVIESQ